MPRRYDTEEPCDVMDRRLTVVSGYVQKNDTSRVTLHPSSGKFFILSPRVNPFPLKPEIPLHNFKNLVSTKRQKRHCSVHYKDKSAHADWGTSSVCSENHMKFINTFWGFSRLFVFIQSLQKKIPKYYKWGHEHFQKYPFLFISYPGTKRCSVWATKRISL